MNKKLTYQTPRVLKEVGVLLEADFLKGSIVDDSMLIVSDGQEVTEVEAGESDFDWNNGWQWE